MNRNIDGINVISKQEKQISPVNAINNKKAKKSHFYYFYKSLKIVVTFWIVIIVVIICHPWLDYFIKSTINNNTNERVLGETGALRTKTELNINKEKLATFYLKNDKLEISAPIVEGISDTDLKKGIGHHPESSLPNQKGNVVLAGHNIDLDANNAYGKVFFNLRDVNIGDEVQIDFLGNQYIYKIFKSETVSSDDTSLFKKTDDWMLTFYTCDPPYTDWNRLVYQAKLFKIK